MSDFRQQFTKLQRLIAPFEQLWQREICHSYPMWKELINTDLLSDILKLTDEELYQLEANRNIQQLSSSELKSLLLEFEIACALKSQGLANPSILINRVSEKKRHEINSICQSIAKKIHQPVIFDVCAGKGHLSQHLQKVTGKKIISIDYDQRLQNSGKEIYPTNNQVEYHKRNIEYDLENLKSDITPSACISLHACGELTPIILAEASSKKMPYIQSMGCCYNKGELARLQWISSIEKKFKLSTEALMLACRSKGLMSKEEFDLKEKVKDFRYTLHLILYHEFDRKEFITLGSSKVSEYKKWNFNDYAKEQFNRLSFVPDVKHPFLEWKEKYQHEVAKMRKLNIIRSEFSRVLEILINLDRAIYLEENGYKVKLYEIFDRNISPRNICLEGSL